MPGAAGPRGHRGREQRVLFVGGEATCGRLLLSNSVRVAVTRLALTPAKEHAPFGIAVNTSGQCTITAPLDTIAKSVSKRSNVKLEEVSAGRPREIPAGRIGKPEQLAAGVGDPTSQRASYVGRTLLAVDGRLVRSSL